MMEDGRGSAAPGSLFGGYQSPYGQGGSGGLSGLSPYLNVDPSYLASQQPEFIRNDVSIANNLVVHYQEYSLEIIRKLP